MKILLSLILILLTSQVADAAAFREPKVLHREPAVYPEEAKKNNREGEVEILVTISADGKLSAAQVNRSSGDASLDAAALDAVSKYTFRAAEKNGTPVEAQALLSIDWTITPAMRISAKGSAQDKRGDVTQAQTGLGSGIGTGSESKDGKRSLDSRATRSTDGH